MNRGVFANWSDKSEGVLSRRFEFIAPKQSDSVFAALAVFVRQVELDFFLLRADLVVHPSQGWLDIIPKKMLETLGHSRLLTLDTFSAYHVKKR